MRYARTNRLSLAGALAAGVLWLSAGPGQAQEWPRFRGPNGEGIGQGDSIPVTWTEKDHNWKVALPGSGHGSPALWGDRIFLTASRQKDANQIVLCLKASDGSTAWAVEYEAKPYRHNQLSHFATCTPAVDKDRLYVCWSSPEQYVLAALTHDGRTVWKRDVGPFTSQHGGGTSAMVYQDTVILTNDQQGKSFLLAVDAATGQTRWQLDRKSGKAAYSTPCIRRGEGGRDEIVLFSTSSGVTGVDAATGKVNWQVADAFPERCVASPIVAGGLIVGACGTGGSGVRLVAVRPGKDAAVAWDMRRNCPYVPTSVSVGDLLFTWTDRGMVSCLEAGSGKVVWQERVPGSFYGSPVCVEGRLYCISTKGDVVVLDAGRQFKQLAVNPLGEKSHATPAVAGGRMYLRTYTHLISVGGKK